MDLGATLAESQALTQQPGTPEGQDALRLSCRLCQQWKPPAQGRLRGDLFDCHGCLALQRSVARHLGEVPAELKKLSREDQAAFFRENAYHGRTPGTQVYWKTVRAALLTAVCSQRVEERRTQISGEFLPLSVWLARGWDESTVKGCEQEESATLGTVYRVDVKTVSWAETEKTVQKEWLEKEQTVERQRKAKRKAGAVEDPEPDLDLPEPKALQDPQPKAKSAKVSEETAARREAAQAAREAKQKAKETAKVLRQNQQLTVFAAKALASLSAANRSVLDKV